MEIKKTTSDENGNKVVETTVLNEKGEVVSRSVEFTPNPIECSFDAALPK